MTSDYVKLLHCCRIQDKNWFGGKGSVRDLVELYQSQCQEVSVQNTNTECCYPSMKKIFYVQSNFDQLNLDLKEC